MTEDRPGRVDPDLPAQAGCRRVSQAIRRELGDTGLVTSPVDRPAVTGYVEPIARLPLRLGLPLPLLRGLVGCPQGRLAGLPPLCLVSARDSRGENRNASRSVLRTRKGDAARLRVLTEERELPWMIVP
jgi:hypothetical protein